MNRNYNEKPSAESIAAVKRARNQAEAENETGKNIVRLPRQYLPQPCGRRYNEENYQRYA